MTDARGESRATETSQSNYSESVVLNKEMSDVDLFTANVSSIKSPYQSKIVTFSEGPVLRRSNSVDDLKNRVTDKQNDKTTELLSRLYDRPENSQAVRVVLKAHQSNQPLTPRTKPLPPIARPPSGKAPSSPVGAFRTVMFKRDYQRRQFQSPSPRDPLPSGRLTVDMLHKQKPNVDILDTVESTSSTGDEASFPELDALLGTGSEPATSIKTAAFDAVSQGNQDKQNMQPSLQPKKLAPIKKAPASPIVTPREESDDDADDENQDLTGEIPIIEKRKSENDRPPSGKTKSAEKPIRPLSGSKLKPIDRKEVKSAKLGARKQDSNVVLTYLKKNKYDDTVPENDSVIDNLLKLRKKVGRVCDIPRHGPGCKVSMEKLDQEEEQKSSTLQSKDDGEFLYCLLRKRKNPRARYDPYDLQVVSPNTARGCAKYWTISATSVTMCNLDENDSSCETFSTPSLWWLWERRLFYTIFELPVFVKFRLWKTFKLWRHNVREEKNEKSQCLLYKRLFVANEVLQGCLIHVRSLCETASGSLSGAGIGESSISLITLDKSRTLKLGEFKQAQSTQCEMALKQLNALRDKIIEIVWESCATVAEMEGVTEGIRSENAKKVRVKGTAVKEEPESSRKHRMGNKAGTNVVNGSNKKQVVRTRPLYAEIAEWRKILARLSSFLRSVDYLLLELLRRLVHTAVKQLLDHLLASYNTEDEDEQRFQPEGSDISSVIMMYYKAPKDDSDSESETDERSLKGDITVAPRTTTFNRFSDRFRRPSSGSITSSTAQKAKKNITESGYVIPQFDFDEPEIYDGPPDIDEVLEEIRHQDDIVEVILPVFKMELVLSVPDIHSHKEKFHAKKHSTTLSSDMIPKSSEGKKTVTFHDVGGSEGETSSSSEGDEEDEDYYSEEESSEEEHAQHNTQTKRKAKFAYSDSDQPSKIKPPSHGLVKSVMKLSPSEEDFKRGIKDIIFGFESTVGEVVSMLREPKLAVFYSPPKHDLKLNYDEEEEDEKKEFQRPWPDLEFVFGEDPEYQTLISELSSYMNMEMELVRHYSANFDPFCTMVDRCRLLNIEESMARKQWSTDDFNHVLKTHTEMVKLINKMIISRRVGMILVNSNNYRESCLPYPQTLITTIHNKLPVIANKRNEDLLTIIKGASRKLDQYPKSVEEFVEHLSFLGKMITELPALEKEFDIVNKMFTIAKDFNIFIVPEELALFKTLGPSFQHLKSTILYCEAKKDENIRKFSTHLDLLIHDIRFKLIDLKNKVRDPDLLMLDALAVSALETIKYLQEEVQILSVKARSYASYQERFGSSLSSSKRGFMGEEYLYMMDKTDETSAQDIQSELSEVERDLTLRRLLWQSQEEWTKLVDEWTATAFDSLHVEALQKNVNRFTQTVYMLEKGLPHNEVVPTLKEKVMDFKRGMPVITSLRNPSLKLRHWAEIEGLIGKSFNRDKSFTLGNLLELNIFQHKDKIQDISTTASNEATLEVMLDKIIDLWQSTDFRLIAHAGRDTFIIAGADDIMAQLEESQVTVGTIRGSRYVTPIKTLVEEWERKLQVFSRTLDEWMNCQRNWLYLEQIFSTPDIQRQLPSEYKMFSQVDKAWKDIMRRVEDRPNALKAAIAPGTLETLQSSNLNLEKIQKCLEDYLETKRLVFPRFYFLSNDELLDILAQSKDPNAVQPHLGKCFGNIKTLDIRQLPRQPPTVKFMTSAEGEVVPMPRNVRARGPVEQWLGSVEAGMFETVKKHLKLGLADISGIEFQNEELQEWVMKHPGQVVLTVSQIMFNKDVMKAFGEFKVRDTLIKVKEKMLGVLKTLAGMVSNNIHPHQRMSIEALLTINVHNRDILNGMVHNNVKKKDDFEYAKQLRYEWDEQSNNCQVLQSNASFQYGYEYLGCSPRLVITPLTDRCYLTLTGALHLHLGGSPAGPAGTGKTETVKDLSKAMGKQCVVFNCSEGLDYKTLGKFFSGLAQSGSWCCFDEFNRIDVEVLSVVAQQIQTIKSAKDSSSLRFMFEGRDIKLNMTCGFFITMNPTYAGRVELPDNLKSLFRQVAMMVPDYGLIAEIMLFSEGFVAAKQLSRKLVNLYQLASKQLSQQDHYDFGMRAIKSVLVMAGHGRRTAQTSVNEGQMKSLSEKEESYILIHSLRDANLPKFLAEDVPLFESILDDLFPGITPPEPDYGILEKAINMAIHDQGLQKWSNQLDKVKQFYNQIMVRHGVMLVGPTGGGKTTVRNILQRALVHMPAIAAIESGTSNVAETARARRQSVFMNVEDPEDVKRQSVYLHNRTKKGHVETFIVNPKCVKLGELYGETNPNTFEWTDGLIASATRKFVKELMTVLPSDENKDSSRPPSEQTLTSDAHLIQVWKGRLNFKEPSEVDEEEIDRDNPDEQDKKGGVSAMMDWRWLVLDGPVDTMWVENLNTVLDDSKVLCLASGERISLLPGIRLIFEVDNLSEASPATISRCAMVYMDPVDLGWTPYVKTWLQRLPKDMPESGKRHIKALFDHSIEKGLKFFRKHSKFQMVPAPEMCLISCLCNILSAFLDFISRHGGFGAPDKEDVLTPGGSQDLAESQPSSRTSSRSQSRGSKMRKRGSKKQTKQKEEVESLNESFSSKASSTQKSYYLQKNPNQLTTFLGKLYVFAYTWSIGGNFNRQEDIDDDDSLSRRGNDKMEKDINICDEFDNFMRDMFEVEPPLGVRLPTGNRSIYSYFVDVDSGSFVAWDSLVPNTKSLIEKGAVITIGETMGVSSDQEKKGGYIEAEIAPTVDIVRFSFLTTLLMLNKHPVLLTGESGIGKSAIINHMLKRLSNDGGTLFKNGTVLGDIFNFSEKSASLLENISNLTRFGQDDDEDRSYDMILGTSKPKHSTGLISSSIQLSAQTSASRLQAQIMLKLIKKGKDTMGAPKGRKVVVFVDDLNMPATEEYGAQPPLELLRQFLELNGFYDTKKLTWKDINDITLIAACAPPGGGRNPVSPRLLKNFCMLALPQPSTRSLQHIYQVQLGRFFQEGSFMPEVSDSLFSLVSASIAVYYRMCSNMLPTPAKSHYTFNIRDLSKVIQGLLQAHETVIVSKEHCVQLFAHEATRVFHDRLVCQEDKLTFFQFLSDNLHDHFKVTWSAEKLMNEQVLFGDFFDIDEDEGTRVYRPISDRKKLTQVLEECYIRMNYGEAKQQATFEGATQMVFFKDAVEHIVRAARVFRQPGGHMILVGLDGTGKSTIVQLASHIAQCEIFKLTLHKMYGPPEFRDDLKKVFIQSGVKGTSTVFLLTDSDIVKESFLEDINCILNSGEVADLFDNEEMDGITMDLKAAASGASIPDTRVAVYQFFIERVRQNLHVVLTMSPAGGRFRQRCRMNPALINCCTIDWYSEWDDEAMLSVAEVFFENTEFIADPQYDIKELKKRVGNVCVDIHRSISVMSSRFWEEMRRYYYSTPSSYMELIRVYSKLLNENRTAICDNKERLLVGLNKLSEANSLVGTMQEELVTLGPKIEEKAKDTEVLLEQLEKDQAAVEEVREIVEQEESVMSKETKIVQDYADECQQDLASVLPALQTAIASLETLDKASIAEIRVYNYPPQLVMAVIAAVCILFQKKPDWPTAKQMLGDPNFLKKLLQFDKNSLPDRVFHRLKKYTKDPDFNPESVGTVSTACRSICEWVLALEHYNEVYKMIKPKQKRVEEAREALKLAEANLAQKQASLQKVQDHLKALQQQYQDSVNQREALKERKKLTALRLQRASVLLTALADEKVRWAESVKDLDKKIHGLVGDTLVVSAAVAYLGPFTAKYRKELAGDWAGMCGKADVPISKDYDMVKSMVDANQVLKWQNEGLPTDSHSTENALFVKKARKWPLLIDPQGQAVNWLKLMEGYRLKTVSASDPNYMRTLETALRVGEPMLLGDVTESLDPALRPVLLHETFRRGGHVVIKLGDTEIEYNQNFRLYLATTMPNPHYLPSIYIQVNIINFTVTFDGLQEQLLSAVVKQERPILENQRSELLASIASDMQLLRDLEDKTLGLLQKSEGHILDDQDLVETLQKSKGMAKEIYFRISESEVTEQKLNIARKRYLPVATRGAVLYFVLADLSGIDVMYQFSLGWFQEMFRTCITEGTDQQSQPTPSNTSMRSAKSQPSNTSLTDKESNSSFSDANASLSSVEMTAEELRMHMEGMINRLTSSIYRVVSVALFANHQLTFSFLVCTSIMRANSKYEDLTSDIGKIEDLEWLMFLQGSIVANMMDPKEVELHDGLTAMERLEAQAQSGDKDSNKHKSPPTWITDIMWKQCQCLETKFSVFDKLCRSIISNTEQWNYFLLEENIYSGMAKCFTMNEDENHSHGLVFPWENLSSFQKLMLIKILRPEAVLSSANQFVSEKLGSSYLSTGSFDLKEVYEESTAKSPLIFILSPGCDPAAQILRFAKELRGSTVHLDMISLGRGQGPKAEELISKAQILKGRWVFLQNCHLAASWMPKLQAIVEKFNRPGNDEVDPQFRLWLSSKPDPCFPTSILQTGIKMTVEPPQGVKANMLRSFGAGGAGAISEKMFEDAEMPCVWRQLLFGLCLFNSIILERKKYGTLGWNIAYEFNDSDLEVSILQLQMLLTGQSEIPWEALTYLTGEVSYGGRVTDDWDRRLLHSLLGKFYCPDSLLSEYSYSSDKIYNPIVGDAKFSNVVTYIENLPNYDTPDIFGMTENAEKACRENQVLEMAETIISIQPRLSAGLIGTQKSNDEIVLEIATDIMKQLPGAVEDEGKKESTSMGTPSTELTIKSILLQEESKQNKKVPEEIVDNVIGNSALVTVLRQEIDRFDNLLHKIHVSLKLLIRAVKGEIIMSESLEEAYNAFLIQKVPESWKTSSYESKKPLGSWIQDLIMRVEFFASWADLIVTAVEKAVKISILQAKNVALPEDSDTPSRIQPNSFWLSGFFFPQGFLTAVLQNHARKIGISVDALKFEFSIQSRHEETEDRLNDIKYKESIKEMAFQGKPPPDDGVVICGLYLDGAGWETHLNVLKDSLPGQRFCRLPQIHFLPVSFEHSPLPGPTASEVSLGPSKSQAEILESYECPLYRTSSRAGRLSSTGHSTNFVTAINLPSNRSPQIWIMRGVALLCQLDD